MPTQAEFDALKERVDAIYNSGGNLTLQQIEQNIVLDPEGHITVTPWLINEIAKRLPATAVAEHDHPLTGRTGKGG